VLLFPVCCLEKPGKWFLQLPNKNAGHASSSHWKNTACDLLHSGWTYDSVQTSNWTCRHNFLYLCKFIFWKFVRRDILELKNIMRNKKISYFVDIFVCIFAYSLCSGKWKCIVTLWEQYCLILLITWLIFVGAFTKQLWKVTAAICLFRLPSVCMEQMDFY